MICFRGLVADGEELAGGNMTWVKFLPPAIEYLYRHRRQVEWQLAV
jgi:hypothetical protein